MNHSTTIIDSIKFNSFNPLNAKLNPFCHLLALLGAHHILHVSRIRVNPHCQCMTFNLALNLVQNDCNYHSHCIIFQYCIFIFVLPRSPCMCLVFIHYGYHIGEK